MQKAGLERQLTILEEKLNVQQEGEKAHDSAAKAQLARELATADQAIVLEDKRQKQKLEALDAEVRAVVEKAKAIGPDLIAALQAFGDQKIAGDLATALAPLSILGGESIADVIGKILSGTAVGDVAKRALGRVSASAVRP